MNEQKLFNNIGYVSCYLATNSTTASIVVRNVKEHILKNSNIVHYELEKLERTIRVVSPSNKEKLLKLVSECRDYVKFNNLELNEKQKDIEMLNGIKACLMENK